jgi:hypothetical protein
MQGTCSDSTTWNTGSNFYVSGQSSTCSRTGFLILGYGSTSSYGNAKALDCKNNAGTAFQYTIKVNNTPSTLGYWTYSVTGSAGIIEYGNVNSTTSNADPYVKIKVNNGYTAWVTFNWIPQTLNLEADLKYTSDQACANEITEIHPNEAFYVCQTVTNKSQSTVPDIYIHNGFNNNGLGSNLTGTGTEANPREFSILGKVNPPTAANDYRWNPDFTQAAGSYTYIAGTSNFNPLSTDNEAYWPERWMAWRKGSVAANLAPNAAYRIVIPVTATSDTGWSNQYFSNNFCTGASRTLTGAQGTYNLVSPFCSGAELIMFRVPPTESPSTLSCSPDPISGESPLDVTFTVTGTADLDFEFDGLGNGADVKAYTLPASGTVKVYYGYPAEGIYYAKATYKSVGTAQTASCGVSGINVKSPGSGTGNEVTP